VFRHEFVVDCEVEKVWNFFTDPKHFEAISPVDLNERLVRASNNTLVLGTDIWISTDLFFRRTWHARVVKLEEPYEYDDEVYDRLLKNWIHRHSFVKIGAKKKTSVIDEITFKFGYGQFGRIVKRIVFTALEPIFPHRASKTKEILQT